MRKIVLIAMIVLITAGFSFSQTENPRDVLFNKLVEKYKNVSEMSAVVEMNMSMMGMTMKMPTKMWMKGNLTRMDVSMMVPGTDRTMEQIAINDGNTISIYNSLNNTLMSVDLNKLPEETRKMIKNQYAAKIHGI